MLMQKKRSKRLRDDISSELESEKKNMIYAQIVVGHMECMIKRYEGFIADSKKVGLQNPSVVG